MDLMRCSKCGQEKPLAAFRTDRSRPRGVKSPCKACDSAARRKPPKPGALVLVMPPRPVPVEAPAEPPGDRHGDAASVPDAPGAGVSPERVRHGHYAAAAEAFLDALQPPAGPADALLVVNLRDLAQTADLMHLGPVDPVDLNRITLSLVKLQRELAATRLAKAADGQTPGVAKSKFEAFKNAL